MSGIIHDYNLFLVMGILLAMFAVPAAVYDYSEERPPRMTAILSIIAADMIIWSVYHTRVLSLESVTIAFTEVISRFLH